MEKHAGVELPLAGEAYGPIEPEVPSREVEDAPYGAGRVTSGDRFSVEELRGDREEQRGAGYYGDRDAKATQAGADSRLGVREGAGVELDEEGRAV